MRCVLRASIGIHRAVLCAMLLHIPTRGAVAQVQHAVALQAASAQIPDEAERSAAVSLSMQSGTASWWTPLASLMVPGSGQFLMKQQRGVGYLVIESYLLVQAASAQRSGNRDRNSYRSVASDVARAQFGGTRPGAWTYYEAMENFLESGRFDAVAGGTIQPEPDENTFNGMQWLLARETFWSNPDDPPAEGSAEYQRALEFYKRRAVTDEYRWSWRDAQLEQDVYRQHIASANRNYQRAINLAGAVAANHLLSLVDAYVTVRLRRLGRSDNAESGAEFSSSVQFLERPSGSSFYHTAGVRLPFPRRPAHR